MSDLVFTRLALGLSYHGEGWKGWQTQPHRHTLQDALEAALFTFTGCHVPTHCAGRTDAGVHAAMQIVHLDPPVDRPLSAWVRGVNAHLPGDLRVRWAVPVDSDFHARFSAISRTYVYVLLVDNVLSPRWQGRVGWSFKPLDVEAMHQGAQYFVGEHDFSSFRAADCQSVSPIRVLHDFNVTQRGRFIYFTVNGNAFLHHMVRNMVGSLVYVGLGKWEPKEIATILAKKNRSCAAPTYSAQGLYLTAVEYPPQYGLAIADATNEILLGV